jgi:hypothetical protein
MGVVEELEAGSPGELEVTEHYLVSVGPHLGKGAIDIDGRIGGNAGPSQDSLCRLLDNRLVFDDEDISL